MSRALPFIERIEDTLIDELKKIGRDEREWFSQPASVLASVSDDILSLPRPVLALNFATQKDEPQMGEKYRTTATVEVHCLTNGGPQVSATRALHRLMADVRAALASALRPANGVLDSGYMFVTESTVSFEASQAFKAGVGVVIAEINWEWSDDAP